MRQRLARKRDTLNVRALPRTPNTHLDYRTQFNPLWFEHLTTLRLIFTATLLGTVVAIAGRLVSSFYAPLIGICLSIAVVFVIYAAVTAIFTERIDPVLAWSAILWVCGSVSYVMGQLPDVRSTYLALFLPSLLFATGFAYLVGKQTAFWITANHHIDQRTMLRWRRVWSLSQTSADPELCPQFRTVPILLWAMPIIFLAGFPILNAMSRNGSNPAAILPTLLIVSILLAVTWSAIHVAVGAPIPSPIGVLVAAWRTLQVFGTYNRHQTPAAGVFRFPSPGMHQVAARDFLLASAAGLLSISFVANSFPPPLPRPISELIYAPKEPPIGFETHEWDYLRSLPADQMTDFMDQLTAEKRAVLKAEMERPVRARQRENLLQRVLVATLLGVFGPPVILLGMVAVLVGSSIRRYFDALEFPGASEHSTLPEWQVLVDRLINSPNTTERQHLLVGSSRYNDYPILLDREILRNHAHILGDTGARKTSLGIAPLATQLIAAKDSSILMIDLKGEPSLFHGLREEARRAGLKFRWFTTTPDWSSYLFNPFLQKHWRKFSSNQRVQIVLAALSLDYGVAYGRGFFTAMNETVFKSLVSRLRIETFDDMHEVLNDEQIFKAFGAKEDWRQARHLAALVNRLRSIHPLNLTPTRVPDRPQLFKNAIDLSELLEEPQVVYFYLKAPIEPLSTAGIAKLALYSLFTAAAGIPHENDKVRTYVMIDEFQQMISDSVRQVLEQGRSLGTTFVLSHQSIGQSKRDGTDIGDTLASCTAFKQTYRASDLKSIMELEELSGQGLYHRMAWIQKAPLSDDDDDELDARFSLDGSVQVAELSGPLLDRNTIMEISADKKSSIVRFTEDSGYTCFGGLATPIVSDFHITSKEFQVRDKSPWPDVDADTVSVQPDYGDVFDADAAEPLPAGPKPIPGPFLLPSDLEDRFRAKM